MTERPIDPAWFPAPRDGAAEPERLAALLDGRLGEAERDALLARLADDEEDLALFAEAAAIQRELEEADAVAIPRMEPATAEDETASVPGVLPLRPPARPARRVDRRWLAAAAVIAGVTLLPLTWRASQGGAVREPSHAVALLENPAGGLPDGWTQNPAWSPTRGGEVVSEEGRPARVGAYMVDLELAIRGGGTDDTRLMAQRIAGLLTDANAAGTAAARALDPIIARPDAPAAELLPALEDASDGAADALGADRYALGAWAEAARLAAARRDAAFFQARRTRRMLDRAETLVGDDAQARTAIAAVRDASRAGAPEWTALRRAADDLLKVIAS